MGKKLKCWVCGAEHDYCPTCGQTNGWKYVADKIECYTLYMTIEDYRAGVKTKEEVIEILAEKCNIHAEDDLSWLLPHIEKYVRSIIGEKTKITKTTRKSKLFE